MSTVYLHDKLEIISDIFGERFYVKELFYDKKFKLKVHYGRPVEHLQGGDRFIVTTELKDFILSTLNTPTKEFDGTIKHGVVNRLRRLLQDNPFKTYEHWVNSKRVNKPNYITFNDAPKNPQILINSLGHRYVLLSALRTNEGLIFPKGELEVIYSDKNKAVTTKYILTHEITRWLEEENFSFPENSPISTSAFYHLCAELGCSPSKSRKVLDKRNTLFVQHIDELINLTAEEFLLNHTAMDLPRGTILHLKIKIAFIMKELQKPQSELISALLEHWVQPNAETSKKVDTVYGRNSSNIRRAFLLLKRAKKI